MPGDEFAFELALCAHMEETTDWLPGRQLGAAVAAPSRRVVDVCLLDPGPDFAARASMTDRTIPAPIVEADIPGATSVPATDAFDVVPQRRSALVDRGVELGVLNRSRDGGRTLIRRTAQYPDRWVDALVAVENKPDLGRPGALERQLRHDASLGLFDRVVLATASHVTAARLNRLPDAVGVWRFDPESRTRTIIREAAALAVDEAGVEPGDRVGDRREITVVSPAAKRRRRRRIAERVYGDGWRTYDFPACERVAPTDDGRPHCAAFGHVVRPATACGKDCPQHEPAEPPAFDIDDLRDDRSAWRQDPPGVAARQVGLDRFQ